VTTADTTPAAPASVDEERVAAFAGQLFGYYTGGFITHMIDLGVRTGVLDAAAEGPATSAELAARAELNERYVREWLGAMVTAGIVEYDAAAGTYRLPPEHAVCLTGHSELNLAPISQIGTHLAKYIGPVAECFRTGGGVPYAEFRPEFTDVMDGLSRPMFDGILIDGIVPLVAGLGDQLAAGVHVADIGCGTGHTTNLLAQAFPRSTFAGYDLAEDAIGRARAEAAELGLSNVSFEVQDVTQLPVEPALGAAFAFDAIHDQADPAGVLARVHDALAPGGVFVMFDIRASSNLEDNIENPMAPMLYAVSTLHCMTVSLASGGAGLGTVWGEELALDMLGAAGFVDLEVHEVPADPMDSVYVARKPA
jgi:SAM-dependent methyltransferase